MPYCNRPPGPILTFDQVIYCQPWSQLAGCGFGVNSGNEKTGNRWSCDHLELQCCACMCATAWQEVKLRAEIEGVSGPVGGSHMTASASDRMWVQMLKPDTL